MGNLNLGVKCVAQETKKTIDRIWFVSIEKKNNLKVILKNLGLGDHESDSTIKRNDIEEKKSWKPWIFIFVKFDIH